MTREEKILIFLSVQSLPRVTKITVHRLRKKFHKFPSGKTTIWKRSHIWSHKKWSLVRVAQQSAGKYAFLSANGFCSRCGTDRQAKLFSAVFHPLSNGVCAIILELRSSCSSTSLAERNSCLSALCWATLRAILHMSQHVYFGQLQLLKMCNRALTVRDIISNSFRKVVFRPLSNRQCAIILELRCWCNLTARVAELIFRPSVEIVGNYATHCLNW